MRRDGSGRAGRSSDNVWASQAPRGSRRSTDRFQVSAETNIGRASVPDPRLIQLRDHYQPKKFTPAAVTYVDIPGMRQGGAAESLDLARLREVDALAHVVRAFEEPEVLHAEGSVDPRRDVEIIDLELILADLEIVARRIERLDKNAKRGLTPEEKSRHDHPPEQHPDYNA